MPKIKIKNIPKSIQHRICSTHEVCSTCPFDLREAISLPDGEIIFCLKDSHYDPGETVIELSEKDFPTNRQWLESLSNEDLAAFYTHGLVIKKYSPYPINISQIIGSFMSSTHGIETWLSKPCVYLMEEE